MLLSEFLGIVGDHESNVCGGLPALRNNLQEKLPQDVRDNNLRLLTEVIGQIQTAISFLEDEENPVDGFSKAVLSAEVGRLRKLKQDLEKVDPTDPSKYDYFNSLALEGQSIFVSILGKISRG